MTKTIFAVDPGVVSGWAAMVIDAEPRLWESGKINFQKNKSAFLAVPDHIECSTLVAIEGQYLDEGKKKNVDSLIKLARKAGRWEEAACAHGLRYEYIQPSVWITAELGKNLRSPQVPVMAKQKCEALYKVSKLSEHEYCAILIGRYVAIREYRKSLQLTISTERSR